GLRKGAVGDDPPVAGELDASALRAGLEPLAGEHDARLDQFLVELAHIGQQLRARQHPGLAVLIGLDDDHEPHLVSPSKGWGWGSLEHEIVVGRRSESTADPRKAKKSNFAAVRAADEQGAFLKSAVPAPAGQAKWRAGKRPSRPRFAPAGGTAPPGPGGPAGNPSVPPP